MQAGTINITGRSNSAPDLSYARSVEEVNASTYREEGMLPGQRDELKLLRNVATVDTEKNFRGNVRTTQRLTKDITVANYDGSGDLTAPIVVELKVTAPVGASQADVDDIVERSMLFATSAEGKTLHSHRQNI